MHTQGMSAAARDAAAGPAYVVTVSTLLRRPLFLDADAARAVARRQSESSIWAQSRCLAWVLLPDRWQGLVVLAAGDSLKALVRRFKQVSARGVEARFRINGWLWANDFTVRVLGSNEQPLIVARRMVGTPVRVGLAVSIGAYPYWNAVWLDPVAAKPQPGGDLLSGSPANTMTG